MQYPKPTNFPKGYILGGLEADSELLTPIVITYPILKNVIKVTHDELSSGNWTPMQATAYLTGNGICTKYASTVVKFAKNCKAYRIALDNRERKPEDFEEMK